MFDSTRVAEMLRNYAERIENEDIFVANFEMETEIVQIPVESGDTSVKYLPGIGHVTFDYYKHRLDRE